MTINIKDIIHLDIDRLRHGFSYQAQSDVSSDVLLKLSFKIHDVKSVVSIDLYRETETE